MKTREFDIYIILVGLIMMLVLSVMWTWNGIMEATTTLNGLETLYNCGTLGETLSGYVYTDEVMSHLCDPIVASMGLGLIAVIGLGVLEFNLETYL